MSALKSKRAKKPYRYRSAPTTQHPLPQVSQREGSSLLIPGKQVSSEQRLVTDEISIENLKNERFSLLSQSVLFISISGTVYRFFSIEICIEYFKKRSALSPSRTESDSSS